MFYALAAFPVDANPRLVGVTFGIDYDPERFAILDFGHCGDYEISDTNWPEASSGTAVTWAFAQTTTIVDVYWFAGYVLGAPTTFDLIEHLTQGGVFVGDGPTGPVDDIADFGRIGFGTDGYLPCPDGPVPTDERSWGSLKAVFR